MTGKLDWLLTRGARVGRAGGRCSLCAQGSTAPSFQPLRARVIVCCVLLAPPHGRCSTRPWAMPTSPRATTSGWRRAWSSRPASRLAMGAGQGGCEQDGCEQEGACCGGGRAEPRAVAEVVARAARAGARQPAHRPHSAQRAKTAAASAHTDQPAPQRIRLAGAQHNPCAPGLTALADQRICGSLRREDLHVAASRSQPWQWPLCRTS
jgi:hypothetical protein